MLYGSRGTRLHYEQQDPSFKEDQLLKAKLTIGSMLQMKMSLQCTTRPIMEKKKLCLSHV